MNRALNEVSYRIAGISWSVLCITALLDLPLSAASELSSKDTISIVLEGIEASNEIFNGSATFTLHVKETRYPTDGAGKIKPVQLLPKEIRFKAKADKAYFWHNGGVYLTDSQSPQPGIFEGAFDGGKYTSIDHTHKSVTIHPKKDMASDYCQDPREFVAPVNTRELRTLLNDKPESLRISGKETAEGTSCVVLESREQASPDSVRIKRYWVDQDHGFITRKIQFSSSGAKDKKENIFYTLDVSDVSEISPGVWAPKTLKTEAFHDKPDVHHVREVVLDSIDLATPISEEAFRLQRPRGYYLHDRILNMHYEPDVTDTDVMIHKASYDSDPPKDQPGAGTKGSTTTTTNEAISPISTKPAADIAPATSNKTPAASNNYRTVAVVVFLCLAGTLALLLASKKSRNSHQKP